MKTKEFQLYNLVCPLHLPSRRVFSSSVSNRFIFGLNSEQKAVATCIDTVRAEEVRKQN